VQTLVLLSLARSCWLIDRCRNAASSKVSGVRTAVPDETTGEGRIQSTYAYQCLQAGTCCPHGTQTHDGIEMREPFLAGEGMDVRSSGILVSTLILTRFPMAQTSPRRHIQPGGS
jgi:hypothetical protein